MEETGNDIPSLRSKRDRTESDDPISLLSEDERDSPVKDDPKDTDYRQSPQRTKTSTPRAKASSKESTYENLTREELISSFKLSREECLKVKEETITLRKKRTADRKDRDTEKKERIRLQKDNKQLVHDIEKSNARCRELHLEVIEKQQEFKEALEERNEQLTRTQEDWLAKVKESTYPSLPDNVVRDHLHGLLSRSRDWIRRWYNERDSVWAMPFLGTIIDRCTSDQRDYARDMLLTQVAAGNTKILKALGFAWLTREMVYVFLESPFFACGNSRRIFEEFYKSKLYNPKKAHSWRAETVRLIRDDLGVPPVDLRGDTLELSAVDDLCASTIDRIIHGGHSVMLREVTAEEIPSRRTELTEICRGFCLLALELWCQKSQTYVMDNASVFEEPFSMNSLTLQPHVSMGMDEDDNKFDGLLPDAVLLPTVGVLGDSNGNNPEQVKVLSRAVVLILEAPPPAMNAISTPENAPPRQQELRNSEAQPEHLHVHESKKRKLPYDDDDLPEGRSDANLTSATSASSRASTKTASTSTSTRQASQVQSIITYALEQVENGDSYKRSMQPPSHTLQERHDSRMLKASSHTPVSPSNYAQQAGSIARQQRDGHQDEKPSSKFQDEDTRPILLPERKEPSKSCQLDVNGDRRHETQQTAPQEEDSGDTIHVVLPPSTSQHIKSESED